MTEVAGTSVAPIGVLLVDDHQIFRESLAALLTVDPGLVVLAEAGTGEEALRLARQHRPDVVLLDVEMPGQSVLTTLSELIAEEPAPRVIVLTMHEDAGLARQLLVRGASAYLVKTVGYRKLLSVVRAGMAESSDVVTMTMSRRSLAPMPAETSNVLSPREVEVLTLAARARTNQQIAGDLEISEGTVKRHLSNVNVKLGATSRLDAVRRATRQRLILVPVDD
ncbi:response regulator transcription factor [Modestobacter sp. VKM Ac-2977]|uniref:response regulator n=1 Tax=Modestobacter sp. VKM Ac-2977 TaxID=3004131 RepID=UPI0022AB0C2F|nr:response regulator transcription factor [Modestobacter sp. VKM Ac-2977]MCZ2819819.1 response regulator transcription factor [Modestobacter sp. VKM Ac-2977]